MSKSKLNTAILGLNSGGQLLLQASEAVDCLEVRAVADKDTSLAEKIAGQYECAAFDDYRQLIIQNQLDCLLVAAPIHSCDEYVRMAMKKKFNVLKLAPAARDFEEAAEFVRLAEEKEIQFAITNPSRYARSFVELRKFLEEGEIENTFLMTAFCNLGDHPQPGWRTDPKLAGGGVLLHDCYRMIDQVVSNFDMPQQIYSLNTNQAQDKQQRLYLTEDTVVITMKFSDTFIGNFIASRREGTGPREQFLKLYAKDRIISVSDTQLSVNDGLGRAIKKSKYDDDEVACTTELLKSFASSILSPDKNKLCSSGRENLKDMAVIESAYLSARTGFPEEPDRILQMASLGVDKAVDE
ncbi:MAG: Gfo/Idh/MocA family protein [Planctomycetota bacterium]|jgi:predicted dehydrogenase